jgi:Cu-Zn family superoxide dismutase
MITAITLGLLTTGAAEAQQPAGTPLTARAELHDVDGRSLGEVRLEETPSNGVLLTVDLEGLEPGVHGFHIHETGRCEGDFSSAGGHFAPRGHAHGIWSPQGRHAGDLLNVRVADDGSLHAERLAEAVTLRDGPTESLMDADGSAIVIHAGADDYRSQPSGAAGARVACGVVRR